MATGTINSKARTITTVYAGGNTFTNDVGVNKTLNFGNNNPTQLCLMVFYTSISSAYRTYITIPYPCSAAYFPVAKGATAFDIVRIEASSGNVTLLSHRDTEEMFIQAVYAL